MLSNFPDTAYAEPPLPLTGKTTPDSITTLLSRVNSGDRTAVDRLIPLVYAELRRLAHRYMLGERAGLFADLRRAERQRPPVGDG